MSDINPYEGVTPGPWGIEEKSNGRVEVNLPGNVSTLNVKPKGNGEIQLSNGERLVVVDEIEKNGVGVDVKVHGEFSKKNIDLNDFKSTINPETEKLILQSWPEGSVIFKNLIIFGGLTLGETQYKVLKVDGEPYQIANGHYLYIPVKDENNTEYEMNRK